MPDYLSSRSSTLTCARISPAGNDGVWILAYPKWARRIFRKPAKSPAVTFCDGTAKTSAAVQVPVIEPLCPGPSAAEEHDRRASVLGLPEVDVRHLRWAG